MQVKKKKMVMEQKNVPKPDQLRAGSAVKCMFHHLAWDADAHRTLPSVTPENDVLREQQC
jgi:hypothetical protein